MRFSGTHFRDPIEKSGETARVDTGIPMFIFEGPAEAFVSSEEAQAEATKLMEKDNVLRWVFKSELIPEIKKVVTFAKTNGASLRSVRTL
jgi:hypothetical protein